MKVALRKSRRRWGFAFVTIILVGAVFVGLAGALGTQVVTGMTASKKRMNHSACRYAAFAGLQHALLLLRFSPNASLTIPPTTMPGNEHVSYTVELKNNQTENSISVNGVSVPPGAVYCAAMGMAESDNTSVELHAMTAVMAHGNPTLEHAAFTENKLTMLGNAESDSYDPVATTFSLADGVATPTSALASAGTVGTNRYAELGADSHIRGNLLKPDSLALAPAAGVVSGNILPISDPVTVPVISPPVNFDNPGAALSDPDTLSSGSSTPAVHDSLTLTTDQTLTVSAGRYFFPNGIDVNGPIELTGVDDTHPVIFFVGNDAKFGDRARVNVQGTTRNFQLVLVDINDGTPQEFTMSGHAQMFGAVLGGKAQGSLSGNASLYGGFIGRSLACEGDTRVVYDQTLAGDELQVSTDWGLTGVTEPKPEIVLTAFPTMKLKVDALSSGEDTAKVAVTGAPVMKSATSKTMSPTFNPAVGPPISATLEVSRSQ